MSNKSLHPSSQLVFEEQQGVVVAPSHKQILSLYKKSENSGIPFDTILEVFKRGYAVSLNEQEAFNRVNSFIAGGKAMYMDNDLIEKRGLWDNIHAKRERIKHGSGEHMRKPGSKGAPTAAALKASQTEENDPCWDNYKQVGTKMKNGHEVPNCVPKESVNPAQQAAIAIAMKKAGKKPKNEEYTGAEPVSKHMENPSSRFTGTNQLTDTYKSMTPGYEKTIKTIKKVVKESSELYECNGNCTCGRDVDEDAKGYKNPTGGLTQKGRDHYNRETGSHLKAPVTTPPSKLKKGSKAANRRKSFCARMGGVKGPMRDEHGRPTRKALALRKWNC
jgi:hypothetical protein